MYTCGPGDGCRLDRRIPAPVLQIGDTSRRSAGPDGPRGYTRGGSRPGPRRYTRSGSRPDRRRTLPHTAGPSVYAKWEHLEATPFSAIPDRRAQPSGATVGLRRSGPPAPTRRPQPTRRTGKPSGWAVRPGDDPGDLGAEHRGAGVAGPYPARPSRCGRRDPHRPRRLPRRRTASAGPVSRVCAGRCAQTLGPPPPPPTCPRLDT